MIKNIILPTLRENGKKIANISIPVLIERAGMTIMMVVSTALTSSLGSVAISALGLVNVIQLALMIAVNALAVGGTVAVARAYGRNDPPAIGVASLQSIVSISAIGVLVTALVWFTRYPVIYSLYGNADPEVLTATMTIYEMMTLSIPFWAYISICTGVLRGIGHTRPTMTVSILTGLVNLVFAYVFIIGVHGSFGGVEIAYDGIGVRGPGLAMLLSRIVGAAAVTVPILRSQRNPGRDGIRMGRLLKYRPNKPVLKLIYQIAIPSSVEQLVFEIGKVITQTLIVGLGTASLAANTIAWSLLSIFNVPGSSTMMSTTTLVGQSIGEGDRKKSRDILWTMTGLVTAVNIVMSVVILFFLNSLIGLYSPEPDVFPVVRLLLLTLLVPISMIWPAGYIVPSGLRAAGDVKYVMTIAIASMWIMRVAGAFLLISVLKMGILGLWISMYMDWIARVVFFVLRAKGEKWFAKSGI